MHCIGVYLESPSKYDSSSRSQFFVTIYGFILFFINLYCNGIVAANHIQSVDNSTHQFSTSVLWNSIISMTTFSFMTIGCQLSLMSGAASTWPGLIHILREMEVEKFFERKDFQHFRRIYISGLGFLITVA
jgi:hypothetical protein